MNEPVSTPLARRLAIHALLFGGAAGVSAIAWALTLHATGSGTATAAGGGSRLALVALCFPVAAVAFGIVRWRDRGLGGAIRFAQAFGAGLAIGLVYAAIYGAFSWWYGAVLNPGIVKLLIEQGALPANADAVAYALGMTTNSLILAFVVALAAAVVVRRRVT